jgi:DNA-binding beta-propeller fold protein YncE
MSSPRPTARGVLVGVVLLTMAGCGAAPSLVPASQPSSDPTGSAEIATPDPVPAGDTPVALPSDHPASALFAIGAEGAPPCGIAGDGETVWIADFRRSAVATIDPETDIVVERSSIPGPCGMDYLDGALFVAEATSKTLVKRDASTLEALAEPVFGLGTIWDVEAGEDAVWFVDRGEAELVKVDPAVNEALMRIPLGGQPSGLAVAGNAVWVAVESSHETLRVDPDSGEIVARIATGRQPVWVAATDELAWVTHAAGDAVLLDAATNSESLRLELGGRPGEPAIVDDAVWIPNQEGGTLSEVGLLDGEMRRTLTIGPGAGQVVFAGGSLWVSGYTNGLVWRVEP